MNNTNFSGFTSFSAISALNAIDLATSLEDKQKLLTERRNQKLLNLSGYDSVEASLTDADTFDYIDKNNNLIKNRIKTPFSAFLDAVEVDHNGNSALEAVKTNPFKRNQLSLVANILNKSIDSLTNEDVNTVGKMHTNYIKNLLTRDTIDPNTSITDNFNNTSNSKIKFLFKDTGEVDKYNRRLVEVANPNTLEDVSKTYANNAYANTNASLMETRPSKITNSSTNNFDVSAVIANKTLNDADGRIGEDIDIAQASAYRMGASILKFASDTTGIGKKAIKDADKFSFLGTVRELNNPEIGQQVADSLAGVSDKTRKDFSLGVRKAEVLWSKGHYLNSIFAYIKQVDRVMAESAPQTAMLSVAGIAGLGTPVGIGALLLAAADQVQKNAEEYKANNKGKEYTGEQYALDFTLNAALLVPEAVLSKLALDRLVTKPLKNIVKHLPNKETALTNYFKTVAISTLGETAQEYAQGIEQTVMTQNRNNAKSIAEIVADPSQVFQGIAGGISAGVTAGAIGAIPTALNIKNDIKRNANNKKIDNDKANTNEYGGNADTEISNKVIEEVNNLKNESSTATTTVDKISMLKTSLDNINILSDTENLSNKAISTINKRKYSIIKDTLKSLTTKTDINEVINNVDDNAKELFNKLVFYSDPTRTNAQEEKQLTELTDIGRKLGLSETEITEAMKKVDFDAKYSEKGYNTIIDRIKRLDNKIAETEDSNTIDSLTKFKNTNIEYLKTIANTQIKKLDRFAQGINTLANTTGKSVKIASPTAFDSSNVFEIHKSNIEKDDEITNKGVFKVLKATKENLNTIIDYLSTFEDTTELKNTYNTQLKTVNDAIKNTKKALINNDKILLQPTKDKTKIDTKNTIIKEDNTKNVTVKEDNNNNNNNNNNSNSNSNSNNNSNNSDSAVDLKDILDDRYINEKAVKNYNNTSLGLNIKGSTVEDYQRFVMDSLQGRYKYKENNMSDLVDEKTGYDPTIDSNIFRDYLTSKAIKSTVSNNITFLDTLITKATEMFENTDILTAIKEKVQERIDKLNSKLVALDNKETLDVLEEKYNTAYKNVAKAKKISKSAYYKALDLKRKAKQELNKEVSKRNKYHEILYTEINAIQEFLNSSIESSYIVDSTKDIKAKTYGQVVLEKYIDTDNSVSNKTLLGVIPVKSNESTDKLTKVFKDSVSLDKYNLRVQKESPALALIAPNGKDFDINVITAIKYSIAETITNNANSINPTSLSDMVQALGLDSANQLKGEDLEFFTTYGNARSTVAYSLGKAVLRTLGIKLKKEISKVEHAKFISNLGNIALIYAEKMQLITTDTYTDAEYLAKRFKDHDTTDKVVPTVKLVDNAKDKVATYYNNTKQMVELSFNNTRNVKAFKNKTKDSYTVKNNRNLTHVVGIPADTLNKLKTTPLKVNRKAIKYVLDNKEFVQKTMGFLSDDEIATLHKYAQKSAIAKNKDILHSIQALEDLYATELTTVFADYFISTNFRYSLDSTEINPQQDKELHRWVITNANAVTTVDMNNEEHMEAFYYAIANAFGYSADGNTTVDTNAFAKDILNIPVETLKKAIETNNTENLKVSTGNIKIDKSHIGLVITALDTIENYQEALATNNSTFESDMFVETDSTTSGFAIRFMQFPYLMSTDMMQKTGINVTGNTNVMHNLKNEQGFLDIYKTSAKNVLKSSVESTLNKVYSLKSSKLSYADNKLKTSLQYHPYKKIFFTLDKIGKEISASTIQTFSEQLLTVFPFVQDDIVSSELRSMMKNPTMVGGYGAMFESIAKNVGTNIKFDLVKNYLKVINKTSKMSEEQQKNILDTFDFIKENVLQDKTLDLEQVLKEEYLHKIKTIYKGYTLDSYLNEFIASTYGEAVATSIFSTFEESLKVSTYFNTAFNFMFSIFEKTFNNEVQSKEIKLKRTLSVEEENEIIDNLFNIFPAINTVFSSSTDNFNENKLTVYDNDNVFNKDTSNTAYTVNNKKSSYTTTSKIEVLKQAFASGGVLPTHMLDASILSKVILSKNILGIHDAEVSSIAEMVENAKAYNKAFYDVNKEYNLAQEILDALTKTYKNAKKYNTKHSKVLDSVNKQKLKEYTENIITTKGYDYFKVFDDEELTLDSFLQSFKSFVNTNNINREKFYSNENVVITNMDGTTNSVYSIKNISTTDNSVETEIIEDVIKNDYNAEPNKFTTDKDAVRLTDNLAEEGVRIEIAERLYNIDTVNISKNHAKYLLSLIKDMKIHNLINTAMQIKERSNIQTGSLTNNVIQVDIAEKTKVLNTDKTPLELYAHELVHKIIGYGLENHKELGISAEVRKLMHVQKLAMDNITPSVLLSSQSTDTSRDSQYAEDVWNYMFNNNDTTSDLKGLHEFIAYGLTNENVINALKSIKLTKEIQYKNVFDKFLKLVRDIFDVIIFKNSPSDLVNNIGNMLSGNYAPKDSTKNLYEQLVSLTDTIIEIDNKNINNVLSNNPISKTISVLGDYINKGNDTFRPIIEKLITIGDRFNVDLPELKVKMSKTEELKEVIKLFTMLLFSTKHREVLPATLRSLGINHSTLIQNLISDIRTPDEDSKTLEMTALLTRKIDQVGAMINSVVHKNIAEGFNRPLNGIEKQALTKGVLYTDLSVLLNDFSIKEIKDILTNRTLLEELINNTEEQFKTFIADKNILNWTINQSKFLARFMVTGKGHEALLTNAYNIAIRAGLETRVNPDENLIALIDKFTTLHAIALNKDELNSTVASLEDKGLENYLKNHKTFVDDSKSNYMDRALVHKGYTKQIFDNSVDIKIMPTDYETRTYMEKLGYTLVDNIKDSEITGRKNLGLYKSVYKISRHRDGATFQLQGVHAMGTSLTELARESVTGFNKDVVDILKNEYLQEANNLKERLTKEMQKVNPTIEGISDNFIPIVNNTGNVVDYRIIMSHDKKEKHLGQELDGIKILSRMYASKAVKINSTQQNFKIFEFLLKDMIKNHITGSNEGRNLKKYVKLDMNSIDENIANSARILPKEIRDVLKSYLKEIDRDALYVREDWLQPLFGVEEISLIDNKTIKKITGATARKFITLGETFLKQLASLTKTNIVLRTPSVIIGNIISNINYSVALGTDPITVLKMQLDNVKNVKDYLTNRSKLEELQHKILIGQATAQETKYVKYYTTRLTQNPLHDLMEMGMYQQIVEDLNPEDTILGDKLKQKIDVVLGKSPKAVKTVLEHAYMLSGTPIYDAIVKLTHYSDFVARATEYQIRTAKVAKTDVKTRKAIAYDVVEAFVNYDKPNHAKEQYLNDLGLLMFTKFSKRIQKVITKSFVQAPISTILFIMGQYVFVDTDDIFEQNAFYKDWSILHHSIIDNMTVVLEPSLYRILK